MSKSIVMFHPYVSDGAIKRVTDVLHSRWIGQGSLVDDFERALEDQLNVPHVLAVNTSSSALRLALSLVDVKPGDEVITTPMTCTLTNHPILEQFAVPVFSDIQYDSGNIDPNDIEHRITSRTKAIVCTHWGGTPCDLSELLEIADRHGLDVIEDASEAMGASYKGKPIGAISRFTAFSFQAIQIITTGEGGALCTTNPEDCERARIQRWYGIDRKGRKPNGVGYYDFDITVMGFGYHMTNLSAAIGLESLNSLPSMLARRKWVASRYRSELEKVSGLTLLKATNDRESSNHFFTVHVERRDDFCRKMKDHGIEVSIVHYRNDAYTVFGGLRRDLPKLSKFAESYVALPSHMFLEPEDVEYIIKTIQSGW